MAITHNAVVVVPDDGTSPVGSDEWNAAHTIEPETIEAGMLAAGVAVSGPTGPTGPTGSTGSTGPPGPAPAGNGYVHVSGGILDTPGPACYALFSAAGVFNPANGLTYYWCNIPSLAPDTGGTRQMYVPYPGTIVGAYFSLQAVGTAGSGDGISLYIRIAPTDYLIATTGSTLAFRYFNNAGLSIPVTTSSALKMKMVCPTWATPPTSVYLQGNLLVAY